MDTNLEKLVQQYADELEWIELESQSLTLDKHISDIINLRDKIQKKLQQNQIDLKTRKNLSIQDKKLKYLRNYQPLQQAFQKYYQEHSVYDLREYWWHYQSWSQNRCLQSIMARDHLWSFIAIICLSLTLILIIDLFLKFFDVTSGFFQTLAIAFPTLITIFIGEGLLTQAGQGWFDNGLEILSRRFYYLKHNRGFWRFISALILLVITVYIGLCFPRIAHNFYLYTGTSQCGKYCGQITEKLIKSTPETGEGKTLEPNIDNHWMSTIKFMEDIKILGLLNLDIKTDKIDLDAAIRNLNYALKIDPNDDYFPDNNAIHYYLGKVYQQVRDFENAHFNYKLAYRGGYDEVLNDIAESYLAQGNYSKAADVLYKATESERGKQQLRTRNNSQSLTLQQIDIAHQLINEYLFNENLKSYSEAFKWIRLLDNAINHEIESQVKDKEYLSIKCKINGQYGLPSSYKCYNYETQIQKVWLAIKQSRITTDDGLIDLMEETIKLNKLINNYGDKQIALSSSLSNSTPFKNPTAYCLRAQVFQTSLNYINNRIEKLKNDKNEILIEKNISDDSYIENQVLRERIEKIRKEITRKQYQKKEYWKKIIEKLSQGSDPPPHINPKQCTVKPEVIVYQLWQQCDKILSLNNAQEKDWKAMFNNYRANLSELDKDCIKPHIQKQEIKTVNQEESLNVHQS